MGYLELVLLHPVRRKNFAGKLDSELYNIWDLVVPLLCSGQWSWQLSPWTLDSYLHIARSEECETDLLKEAFEIELKKMVLDTATQIGISLTES